jgi:molybdopterin-guanine dinucleotide biosynthesis protein A
MEILTKMTFLQHTIYLQSLIINHQSLIYNPPMFTISIQAGGRSTRMGQDKALLPFLGQPLIQRVIMRVAHLADEVIVTTNIPRSYGFLGVPLVTDLIPGMGALGGLYTALATAHHPLVGLVACDLPFANPDLLEACREILLDTGVDAILPATERGLEPLHAVYRVETCLPLIKAALDAEKRRMIAWHKDAKVRILPPEGVAEHDPYGVTFWNVNTPEEFQKAEARALELARER